MRRRGILAACLLVTGIFPAQADDDQDAARHALEAGKALPFDRILERAHREHPGEVLGVEIEPEDDRLIYELRILAPGGRIGEWRYDARTGQPVGDRYGRENPKVKD